MVKLSFSPNIHNRHSIRLRGYDYTCDGAYFITICTQDRSCLFGGITNNEMNLNEIGKIVYETWRWLSVQYDYVALDEMIVMPDHLHGIIIIADQHGRGDSSLDGGSRGDSRITPTKKRKTIGRLIGAFKTVSTKKINELVNTPGSRMWQRDYYEHIIRNNEELNRIREYISNNVIMWKDQGIRESGL